MSIAKILWVDDEIDSLTSQIMFLENKGYEVQTKTNGFDAIEFVKENQFSIVNIDSTIVLESPKISNLIPKMIDQLSEIMGILTEQVSIKAKTSEKLGFIGREEGISAYAVCLIQKV